MPNIRIPFPTPQPNGILSTSARGCKPIPHVCAVSVLLWPPSTTEGSHLHLSRGAARHFSGLGYLAGVVGGIGLYLSFNWPGSPIPTAAAPQTASGVLPVGNGTNEQAGPYSAAWRWSCAPIRSNQNVHNSNQCSLRVDLSGNRVDMPLGTFRTIAGPITVNWLSEEGYIPFGQIGDLEVEGFLRLRISPSASWPWRT